MILPEFRGGTQGRRVDHFGRRCLGLRHVERVRGLQPLTLKHMQIVCAARRESLPSSVGTEAVKTGQRNYMLEKTVIATGKHVSPNSTKLLDEVVFKHSERCRCKSQTHAPMSPVLHGEQKTSRPSQRDTSAVGQC